MSRHFSTRESIVIIPLSKAAKSSVSSFEGKVAGKLVQGLLVRKGKKYFAYENLCKHLAVTLDLNDNRFLTEDKKHLQCQMHGALYDLENGLCVEGPCKGASLNIFEIKEEPTRLIIKLKSKG